MRVRRLQIILALTIGLQATMASAQSLGGSHGSGGGRNRNAASQTTKRPPDLPAPREVWPRLDAGAVLCRSRDDLVARATMDPGQLPPGCKLVQEMAPIAVLNRVPPSSTEVRVSSSGETGWTDVYLPDKPVQR